MNISLLCWTSLQVKTVEDLFDNSFLKSTKFKQVLAAVRLIKVFFYTQSL